MANGRCRRHGGLATGPRTLAAGGRYSRGLGRLAGQWDELLSATDLLDLAPGLALMDLATNLRLQRGIEDQDTPGLRARALEHLRAFTEQLSVEPGSVSPAALGSLAELRRLLEEGAAADEALSDAAELAHRRNSTTVKALELQLRAETSVPRQTVTALLSVVAAAIRSHAPDAAPAIFADVSARLVEVGRRTGVPLRLGQGPAVDAAAAVPG